MRSGMASTRRRSGDWPMTSASSPSAATPIFNRTWENAELQVRVETLDNRQKGKSPDPAPRVASADDVGVGYPSPPDDLEDAEAHAANDRPTIHVDPSTTQVATTLGEITTELLRHGDYFT